MKTTASPVVPLEPSHLPGVHDLVNAHLSLLAPSWVLTEGFIASHLHRNPRQPITDPWVVERTTLCALLGEQVVAAAHLLRYGPGPAVGPSYRQTGDIAWFVAWPDANEAAASLLEAAHAQMQAWGVVQEYACDAWLPVGPFVGTPDVWPHIAGALTAAGFQPGVGNEEVVCGGGLDAVPPPTHPPVGSQAGLGLRRRLVAKPWARRDMRFAAISDGQEIGRCDVAVDLTEDGELPALQNWSLLSELEVAEPWRNRGVGTWLVRHAVAWVRLAGRTRLILATMADNEGAIRFYRRLGWEMLVLEQKGWIRQPEASSPIQAPAAL